MKLTGVSIIFCGRDELPINYLETYFTTGGYAVNKIHSYYAPFERSIISDKGIGLVFISSHFLESSKCMKYSSYLIQQIKNGQLLPVITTCTNLENEQGYIEHWNHTNGELSASVLSFINFLKQANCFYYKDGPTDGAKLVQKVSELKKVSVSSDSDLQNGITKEDTNSLEVFIRNDTNDLAQEASDNVMDIPAEGTTNEGTLVAINSRKEVSSEVPMGDGVQEEEHSMLEVSNEAIIEGDPQVESNSIREDGVQEEVSFIKKLERILKEEAENDTTSVEYYEKVLEELNDKLNEIKVENRVASLEREIKKVKEIQTLFLTMIKEVKKKAEEQNSVEELSKVYENQIKETKRFYTLKIEKLQSLLSQKDMELERLRLALQQDQEKKANAIAEKNADKKEKIELEEETEEEKQRKIRRATIKSLIKKQEIANKTTEEPKEQIESKGSNQMTIDQSIKITTIDQNELLQNKIFDLFSEYEKELQEKYKSRVEGIDPSSPSDKDQEAFDKRIDPFGNGGISK